MANSVTKIKEVKNLKSDLERLRDDLGKLLSRVSETSIEEGGDAWEKAQNELHDLRAQIEQTYKTIREQSGAMREQVEASVEKRPLTSLLVAFGAGALLGSILGRRQ